MLSDFAESIDKDSSYRFAGLSFRIVVKDAGLRKERGGGGLQGAIDPSPSRGLRQKRGKYCKMSIFPVEKRDLHLSFERLNSLI